MAILRTNKRQDFTILPNSALQNASLSWEARGLLAYLLSLPHDWEVHLSDLANRAPSGKDKLSRIVKELGAHGFIVKTHLRAKSGRFKDWIYDVFDESQGLTVGGQTPSSVNPKSASPTAVNPPLKKTHSKKNTTQKEIHTKKPAPMALSKSESEQARSFLNDFGFSWAGGNHLGEGEALRVANLHKLDAGQAQRAVAEFAAEALRGFRKSPSDAWYWLCRNQAGGGLAHTQSGDRNMPKWGG